MLEPSVVAELLLAAGLPAGALMSTRSDQAALTVPGGLWLTRPGLIQGRLGRQRGLFGSMIDRHMCATGVPS